jgi:c-di-GMP-binding flagellar brake protein YcgR
MTAISAINPASKNTSKNRRRNNRSPLKKSLNMTERRKYPRIAKSLPLKISDDGQFDIVTETKNISANGVYCCVSKPIKNLTKLSIILLIPFQKNKKESIRKVKCEGIVVREDEAENIKDNGKHPYRIGIFFNNIKERDKKSLATYIDSHLTAGSNTPI